MFDRAIKVASFLVVMPVMLVAGLIGVGLSAIGSLFFPDP